MGIPLPFGSNSNHQRLAATFRRSRCVSRVQRRMRPSLGRLRRETAAMEYLYCRIAIDSDRWMLVAPLVDVGPRNSSLVTSQGVVDGFEHLWVVGIVPPRVCSGYRSKLTMTTTLDNFGTRYSKLLGSQGNPPVLLVHCFTIDIDSAARTMIKT